MASSLLRVRFAPSPTGELHLGSAMVALANASIRDAAHAAGSEASLVLRIDDTDVERSDPELTAAIIDDLGWLGIDWDEGPIWQGGRREAHAAAISKLLASGRAYHCFCIPERLAELRSRQLAAGEPPRYDGRCRDLDPGRVAQWLEAGEPAAVRLRIAGHASQLQDAVFGIISTPEGSFGDPVVQRADGTPTYILASVVDDIDLGITMVCRGEDHLPNSAAQLALFGALGAVPPLLAHLPLLRRSDGRKLSKRDPLGTVGQLRAAGYQAEAVRRYLGVVLGQGDVDLVGNGASRFDLGRVPRSAPQVDAAQLDAIGRMTMVALAADSELMAQRLAEFGIELPSRALRLVQDVAGGCSCVQSVAEAVRVVLAPPPVVDRGGLADLDALTELSVAIAARHGEDAWADAAIEQVKASVRVRGGRMGDALRTVRHALTGQGHGPALAVVLEAIGIEDALARIGRVLAAAT